MQSPAYVDQKEPQKQQQRRRRSRHQQTHQNSRQQEQQPQQPSTDPKSCNPIKASDYAEIFGGYSYSIPVLDLPPVPCAEAGSSFFKSSSKIDYLDIFGGFVDSGFGVPYEEVLNYDTSASSPNGGLDKETKHDVLQSSQASNVNGGSGIKSSQTNGAKKGFDRTGDNLNAEDTSANEQYHSCSSSDESTSDCPNGVKLEDGCFVHSASSSTSSSSSTKSPKTDVLVVAMLLKVMWRDSRAS